MEDILSQLSFDEGIAMPIANEENKQYEAEVYAYFDKEFNPFLTSLSIKFTVLHVITSKGMINDLLVRFKKLSVLLGVCRSIAYRAIWKQMLIDRLLEAKIL